MHFTYTTCLQFQSHVINSCYTHIYILYTVCFQWAVYIFSFLSLLTFGSQYILQILFLKRTVQLCTIQLLFIIAPVHGNRYNTTKAGCTVSLLHQSCVQLPSYNECIHFLILSPHFEEKSMYYSNYYIGTPDELLYLQRNHQFMLDAQLTNQSNSPMS